MLLLFSFLCNLDDNLPIALYIYIYIYIYVCVCVCVMVAYIYATDALVDILD